MRIHVLVWSSDQLCAKYVEFVNSHTWYASDSEVVWTYYHEVVWGSMGIMMKQYETAWNGVKLYEICCIKYVPVYTGTQNPLKFFIDVFHHCIIPSD